ncbi:MAG: 6-phosphogluconolactonase [Herminiimonas sp.]|nr:6-phosphogluconolactonase [Herminiimonas sp.]
MTLSIERFPDAAQAAAALAQAIGAGLGAALRHQPRALLLVSGGRSPLVLFEALSAQPLDWTRIDISLVDERCVRSDDSASNAALVRSHLMCGAAAAARWIGLMPEDRALAGSDPWEWAQQAAAEANANPALARPAVVVLGVGTDGHTASLFADAAQWPLARTTALRYLAVQPNSAPHARVSLSLAALRKQGRCKVWAVGPDKLQVLMQLQQSVAGPGSPTVTAGPVACLIADPAVTLQAYCSEQSAA